MRQTWTPLLRLVPGDDAEFPRRAPCLGAHADPFWTFKGAWAVSNMLIVMLFVLLGVPMMVHFAHEDVIQRVENELNEHAAIEAVKNGYITGHFTIEEFEAEMEKALKIEASDA